jgi:hypothetical protein
MLKVAAFCRGGKSLNVARNSPTYSCAGRVDHLRSDQSQRRQFQSDPVAVARDIRQTMPVTGSFVGATDAFLGMSVEVRVLPVS